MKKIIGSKQAPAAIGPYSQGVKVGNFLFVSGQLPIDPDSGSMANNVEAQTKQSLNNLQAIIEASDMRLNDVVKVTVFLADMNDFIEMNDVYSMFFTDNFPARVAVEVARLPKDALVEIDAVVYRE